MKIAVMGTHGVRKTKLAAQICENFSRWYPDKRVRVAPELARLCPLPINENMSVESQTWMFHAQVKMELEYEMLSDILICDRTVIDCFAYALWAGFTDFVVDNIRSAVDCLKHTTRSSGSVRTAMK